jgi:hypothetical protein
MCRAEALTYTPAIRVQSLGGIYVQGAGALDALLHQPTAESLLHQPTAESLLHQPTAESLLHQPTAESILHQPTAESILHQPTAESGLQECPPYLECTEECVPSAV